MGQKISEHHNSEEGRKKLAESKFGNNNPMKRPEVSAKRLESFMKREDRTAWNKGKKLGPNLEHSERMTGRISSNKGRNCPEKVEIKCQRDGKSFIQMEEKNLFSIEGILYVTQSGGQ